MKTDFTERLRDFLKSEGLEFRLNVDFDSQGNVDMIIASREFKEPDIGIDLEGIWYGDVPEWDNGTTGRK